MGSLSLRTTFPEGAIRTSSSAGAGSGTAEMPEVSPLFRGGVPTGRFGKVFCPDPSLPSARGCLELGGPTRVPWGLMISTLSPSMGYTGTLSRLSGSARLVAETCLGLGPPEVRGPACGPACGHRHVRECGCFVSTATYDRRLTARPLRQRSKETWPFFPL